MSTEVGDLSKNPYLRGAQRGLSLALDPSVENYRQVRSKRRVVALGNPWEMAGDTMRDAMDQMPLGRVKKGHSHC